MREVMRTPAAKDDVWMAVAHETKRLSKDPSTRCGAVLIDTRGFLLGVGYNGGPPQMLDHMIPWHERRPDRFNKYHAVLHSEVNCVLAAVEAHGFMRLGGATLYVTGHPCPNCMLHMIRAGVRRIVWDARPEYQPKMADEAQRAIVRDMLDTLKGCFIVKLEPYTGQANGT